MGAPSFALVTETYLHEREAAQILEHACTPEQRDDPAFGYYLRGLGYAKHMNTHASSVIADFERAILLNPDYEPLVRDYLARARRVLSDRG